MWKESIEVFASFQAWRRRGVTLAVKCAHAWRTAGVSKAAFYHLYHKLEIVVFCLATQYQPRYPIAAGYIMLILS